MDFKAKIFIKRNVFEQITVMLSGDSFPIVINIIKIQVKRLPNNRPVRVKFTFDLLQQLFDMFTFWYIFRGDSMVLTRVVHILVNVFLP